MGLNFEHLRFTYNVMLKMQPATTCTILLGVAAACKGVSFLSTPHQKLTQKNKKFQLLLRRGQAVYDIGIT